MLEELIPGPVTKEQFKDIFQNFEMVFRVRLKVKQPLFCNLQEPGGDSHLCIIPKSLVQLPIFTIAKLPMLLINTHVNSFKFQANQNRSFSSDLPGVSSIHVFFRRKLIILCAVLSFFALAGCGDQSAEPGKQSSSHSVAELKAGNWGPQETVAGTPANQQPNGKSAIWIEVTGLNTGVETQVLFGGQPMEDVTASDKLVTAAIPAALLQNPGDLAIIVVEGGSQRKLNVGTFKITPKAAK